LKKSEKLNKIATLGWLFYFLLFIKVQGDTLKYGKFWGIFWGIFGLE